MVIWVGTVHERCSWMQRFVKTYGFREPPGSCQVGASEIFGDLVGGGLAFEDDDLFEATEEPFASRLLEDADDFGVVAVPGLVGDGGANG